MIGIEMVLSEENAKRRFTWKALPDKDYSGGGFVCQMIWEGEWLGGKAKELTGGIHTLLERASLRIEYFAIY